MVDWKTPNTIIALGFIAFAIVVFFMVLLRGLGGEQAVFLVLGYIGGWLNSIIFFFFRKKPPEPGGKEPK